VKVLFNIAGEQSEEKSCDKRIIDDSDDGESFGNEIEWVDKVKEAKKATHNCSVRNFLIFAAKNIAKHGRGRA
jgi:hypothetical protein